ncbi:MAG: DMT family transporter [Acetobacteraceae bacterium]|jgi:drug/metabolite transporter (DMT)-like permease|nr:DMT family transporter [Acetobacteraceae bacterium]
MPRSQPIPRAALAQLAIVVVVFGAAGPVIRVGLEEATPAWLAFWRAFLSCSVTALLVGVRGRLVWPRRRDWAAVIAVGVFQLAAFFALLHLALTIVPVGRSVLLCYTTSLWLVPISVFVLKERLDAARVIAVLLGLAGVATLANPAAVDWADPRQLPAHGLLLLAALSWAIAIAVLRATPAATPLSDLLPWQFGLAAVLLLPAAALLEPGGGVRLGWSSGFALLYLGVLGGPLATWAAASVSRELPVVVSSLGFLGVPVVSVALSVLFLDEALSLSLVGGGALILAGLATLALRR